MPILSIHWHAFHDNTLFKMKSHKDHWGNTGLNWIRPIGSGYITPGQPRPLHRPIGQIQTGGSGAVSETAYADDERQRTP